MVVGPELEIRKNNETAHYWLSPDSGPTAGEVVDVTIFISNPSATPQFPGNVGVSLSWAWYNSWHFCETYFEKFLRMCILALHNLSSLQYPPPFFLCLPQ